MNTADLMTAVSVTRSIIRWDLNCYAGGSQAVSRRDLKRQGLGGGGEGCSAAVTQTYIVFLPGVYEEVSVLNIHKAELETASQKVKKNQLCHKQLYTKVNTGSLYSSRKQGKFLIFISTIIASGNSHGV